MAHGGDGRPVVAPSRVVAGGFGFGQREERGEESKRERERCVGMIDERENEWRGIYIIPSPR